MAPDGRHVSPKPHFKFVQGIAGATNGSSHKRYNPAKSHDDQTQKSARARSAYKSVVQKKSAVPGLFDRKVGSALFKIPTQHGCNAPRVGWIMSYKRFRSMKNFFVV